MKENNTNGEKNILLWKIAEFSEKKWNFGEKNKFFQNNSDCVFDRIYDIYTPKTTLNSRKQGQNRSIGTHFRAFSHFQAIFKICFDIFQL